MVLTLNLFIPPVSPVESRILTTGGDGRGFCGPADDAMKRLMRLVVISVVALNVLLHASTPLSLTISPKIQLAVKDATVHVKVRAEHDVHNRSLCVDIDGGMFWSDCRDFVGEGAPYAIDWWVPGLTAGDYVATATLTREGGKVITATDTFIIYGDTNE